MRRYTFVAFKPFGRLEDAKDSEIGHVRIFAHGVITKIVDSPKNNHRWYKVNWTVPDLFLEVPNIGCTKAIADRDVEVVEDKMLEDFRKWLDSTLVL
jgi:hypothetical protein